MCSACGSHDGAMDHIVAPAANRLARREGGGGQIGGQFGVQPAIDRGDGHHDSASSSAVNTEMAA